MFNAMRFWLDKGVDGFRVDVMWHMIKDDQFRDNPINPDYTEDKSPYDKYIQAYNTDQPEVHEIVKKMRNVMDEYDERVMIGEIYLPIDKLVTYYGEDNEGTHLPFNFLLVVLPWDARKIEAAVNEYEVPYHRMAGQTGYWEITIIPGWPPGWVKNRQGLQQCFF